MVVRAACCSLLLVVATLLMRSLVLLMAALAGIVRFDRAAVLRRHLCFITRWLHVGRYDALQLFNPMRKTFRLLQSLL